MLSTAFEAIEIVQKTAPSASTPNRRSAARTRSSEPRIDSPAILAPTRPPPSKSRCKDIQKGVVSLIAQRGRAEPERECEAAVAPSTQAQDQRTFKRACRLRAGPAQSAEEIDAAHGLVNRRYAWRGYDIPALEDHGAAIAPRGEITFVASDDVDTVGTLTLGLDGERGLLAERTHGDAVAQRRAAGASVCELTRLAVAERADSRSVLAALFNVAYVAGSRHGVTDVFIEVNPRHVAFYTRVLGFAVAAAEKFCERVQAPSVLLSLAIEELERRLLALDLALAPLTFSARAA